jgi:hypothetical protein
MKGVGGLPQLSRADIRLGVAETFYPERRDGVLRTHWALNQQISTF